MAVPFQITMEDLEIIECLIKKRESLQTSEHTRSGSTTFVPTEADFLLLQRNDENQMLNQPR
jgi:hypothetical protein